MNKKIISLLSVLVFILLIIWGYNSLYNPKVVDNEGKSIKIVENNSGFTLSNSEKERITNVINNYNSEINHRYKFSWLREDDKFIGLSGIKMYEVKTEDHKYLLEIINYFKDFFNKQDFSINDKNNIPKYIKVFSDPRIGFEKDNFKCLLTWNEGNDIEIIETYYLTLTCGNYTKEAEEEFNTFYPLLASMPGSKVWVDKKTDLFARGSTVVWRSGAKWYASKDNGEWRIDEITQDSICFFEDIINRYPKDFFTSGELKHCKLD